MLQALADRGETEVGIEGFQAALQAAGHNLIKHQVLAVSGEGGV